MRPLSLPPPPRALPSTTTIAENQSATNPTLSSTTSTSTCSPRTCKWKPYSNSNDFEANAILVLIILFCALTCALALNAAIRCFLRDNSARQQRSPNRSQQQRKPAVEAAAASVVAAPTLVYSPGLKLTGAEADECVICLSEFVEGDVIQVLPRCNHGFHMKCIQQWLSSHYSCPTCRCSCFTSSSPSLNETTVNHEINLQSSELGVTETESGRI
ncbi:putative RING-H2 finger protein ATL79 [Melia azedarach]|uniref:RING-H2 finger protein ATL79 n=1 Tax=Melia azedarach TaxID=155640 RepID=A0ACC1XLK6_MELAZ|nr:putative RING-H2 finger protein ATL79 [Melia azedarach]